MYIDTVMKKYEGNPIIQPTDIENAYATFNCGQTMCNGQTILLVAVIFKNDPIPQIHVARSDDGIHFEIEKEPFITRAKTPHITPLDEWVIDPRVTYVPEDDMYYIMRPMNSEWGCSAMMGRTKDFKTFEEMDIISLPNNRVPCLFPGKINGKYARLDRPYAPGSGNECGPIWLSYSEDLIHWGEHRPVLKPWIHWNKNKIGPTPPIKTDDGWLVIIHGVLNSCSDSRYSIGAVLLDLEDPSKVIGKANSCILTPTEPYEFHGTVPNVVFPCGAIADIEEDRLRIYYGCADTYIGLATGKLSKIIKMCKEGL